MSQQTCPTFELDLADAARTRRFPSSRAAHERGESQRQLRGNLCCGNEVIGSGT
jgi:hypothetical protein